MIEWFIFVAASVVANTPLPIAFDPIMLRFAHSHAGRAAWMAAIVGAIGAGIGGASEIIVFRFLRRRVGASSGAGA